MKGVVCLYDPKRDFQEVQQGLSPDLDAALKSGIVADSGQNLDYNGIEDPGSIIGVVRDRFDAVDAQRAIRKYGKNMKAQKYVQSNSPDSSGSAPAAGSAAAAAPAASGTANNS